MSQVILGQPCTLLQTYSRANTKTYNLQDRMHTVMLSFNPNRYEYAWLYLKDIWTHTQVILLWHCLMYLLHESKFCTCMYITHAHTHFKALLPCFPHSTQAISNRKSSPSWKFGSGVRQTVNTRNKTPGPGTMVVFVRELPNANSPSCARTLNHRNLRHGCSVRTSKRFNEAKCAGFHFWKQWKQRTSWNTTKTYSQRCTWSQSLATGVDP